MIRRQLFTAFLMTAILTICLGVAYPLMVTGVAQVTFGDQANGSLIERNGMTVGSTLIGQSFLDDRGAPLPQYFQPRPSAAGDGYDASASSGSNLGPSNPDLLALVADRVSAYRELNQLDRATKVPVDAVTASASGLDPHISLANARLQTKRVAAVRGLSKHAVIALVDAATEDRTMGFMGEPGVNVVELNLALDATGA